MRKWNAVLSAALLVLFLLHGLLGAYQLFGVSVPVLRGLSWLTAALAVLHGLLGLRLTWESLRVWRRTGVSYWRENSLFWARRISGFALLLLLFFHVGAFQYGAVLRLRPFRGLRLASHLLLAAAAAVHVLSNLRPLLIALGVREGRKWIGDLLLVLSLLLLFMAASFAVYYLRWKAW